MSSRTFKEFHPDLRSNKATEADSIEATLKNKKGKKQALNFWVCYCISVLLTKDQIWSFSVYFYLLLLVPKYWTIITKFPLKQLM